MSQLTAFVIVVWPLSMVVMVAAEFRLNSFFAGQVHWYCKWQESFEVLAIDHTINYHSGIPTGYSTMLKSTN